MTVHFIGAGPGAPDLITVRGRDLIARCPVCLYAGSIAPPELLTYCPADARIVDTAPLTLGDIEAEFVAAHRAGHDVARLQSGDLSVYSALAEQLRRLDRLGIPYTLTPGVPAFAAAAAALLRELTVPEVAQSVVLTRVSGRALKCRRGDACSLRRDGRDARHPSRRAGAWPYRGRAKADLRVRLSGRGGGRCEQARRKGRAGHARRHRIPACRRTRSSARPSSWSGMRLLRTASARARSTIRSTAAVSAKARPRRGTADPCARVASSSQRRARAPARPLRRLRCLRPCAAEA